MENILWWYWLVFSGILIIFEIFTGTFAFLIISVGGLLAMVLNLCALNTVWQIIGFAVGALIMFLIIKSFPDLWSSKNNEKFCNDAIIDKEGIVLENIDGNNGLVKVGGEEWRAVSQDNTVIEKDSCVIVKDLKGVKLIVIKK